MSRSADQKRGERQPLIVSDNPYANDLSLSHTPSSSSSSSTASVGGTTTKSDAKLAKSFKTKTLENKLSAPQRRVTQKFKLLPTASNDNEDDTTGGGGGSASASASNNSSSSGNGLSSTGLNMKKDAAVYSQVSRIKEAPARKDAERLGKKHRSLLPRVTAYCTSGSYKMKELVRWLKDNKRYHNTSPKLFDECLYTPFSYHQHQQHQQQQQNAIYKRKQQQAAQQQQQHDNASISSGNNGSGRPSSSSSEMIRLDDEGGEIDMGRQSDLFIFDYGVIVMWGLTPKEEKMFLLQLERFENEKLADEDVQIEEFNYYITKSYQPRIYNDFITLRDNSNYMLKLSISHAVAQSVKISLFEELVDNTIEDTQDIPQQIAIKGKVEMSREEIMKSIGELFILRININLHGSVLDSPELMWAEPQLEPIYQATRGYLEINQRVALLNQRLEVVSDLLQMLKEQLGHSNDEYLEIIVIVLICVEVFVSLTNIAVDIIAEF